MNRTTRLFSNDTAFAVAVGSCALIHHDLCSELEFIWEWVIYNMMLRESPLR